MVEAGAALLDVGARSTAPYRPTAIGEDEEGSRLRRAIGCLVQEVAVPISADTRSPGAARIALDAGARLVNDVSGLADPGLARLVASRGVGAILTASPVRGPVTRGPLPPDGPIGVVRRRLGEALERAAAAGIPDDRIVLDPGIGFFREEGISWDEWDVQVLAHLSRLRDLGRPLAVGVSRKSFVGVITGRVAPADRLAGSLAATAVAVLNGAALVRTHDVAETLDAVRVAERLRTASRT
jgi:dihydropteroate synthase